MANQVVFSVMICPLCTRRIKDSPAAEWEPRVEVPTDDPDKRVYAHMKCAERKLDERENEG